MSTAAQLFSEIYDKALVRYQSCEERSQDYPELTTNDSHYLEILYTLGTTTVTAFAEKASISKPAATRIINAFLEKRYLTKTPSTIDKRVIYLDLVPEMKEHCRKNFELADRIFDKILDVLSDDDKQTLYDLMGKIHQSI